MEKNEVLYQIKAFDKQVIRYFIQNTKELSYKLTHAPTPTQIQIMEYLIFHRNEEIYQKDLEEILNLRRATVSGVLQTMEKNGLIERVIPKEDARAKKIRMKDSAKIFFQESQKTFKKIGDIVCEGIEESELIYFCKILEKMQSNLENKVAIKKKGVDDL